MVERITLDPDELVRASSVLENAHNAYKNQAKWLVTPKTVLMDPGVWAAVEANLVEASARLGVQAVKTWSKGNELKVRAAIARDPYLSSLPPEVIELIINSHIADISDLSGHDAFEGGYFNLWEGLLVIPGAQIIKDVDEFLTTTGDMIDAGVDQWNEDEGRDDLGFDVRWRRATLIAMIPLLRKEIVDLAKDAGKDLGKRIGGALGRKVFAGVGGSIGTRVGATLGVAMGATAGGAAAGVPSAGAGAAPGAVVGGAGGGATGAVLGHEIGAYIGGALGEWIGEQVGGAAGEKLGEIDGEALADRAEGYLRGLLETDPYFGGSTGGGGSGW